MITRFSDDGKIVLMSYEGLDQIPSQVTEDGEKSRCIEKLFLKRNRLKTLPKSINNLTNLMELHVGANFLTSLPEALGSLGNLRSLDLSQNCLTSLPRTIGQLANLHKLVLNNNSLTSLPSSFGNLCKLSTLDLAHNQLRNLDLSVCLCGALTRLQCDQNLISTLPRQICRLEQLEELSACGNLLLYLPIDLGHLPKLRCLYVDGNPFLNALPVSVTAIKYIGVNACGARTNLASFVSAISLPVSGGAVMLPVSGGAVMLPREIRSIGSKYQPVTSLLELALRAAFVHHRRHLTPDDLPENLLDLILAPTASCLHCSKAIFTTAHPVVFHRQPPIELVYLGLCCSLHCCDMAKCRLNLPVMYPSE